MQKGKRLSRIDNFKWIAALLVAANHTSPLESINTIADFLLTRVLARLAVPFFLMVTGYFVLAPLTSEAGEIRGSAIPAGKGYDYRKVLHSIRKTILLYLMATILYLPIQIYKSEQEVHVLKAVFFDGTYYHLWYLPAVVEGVVIVALLLRYLPGQAMAVAIGLYGIGLLGDSYYGVAAGLPWLKKVYDGLFHLFSYTRNGLFMAPLFLLLGRQIAVKKTGFIRLSCPDNRQAVRYLRNFIITLFFMCVEGLVLNKGGIMLHDSMYLILPVCMWYLFSYLADTEKNTPLWKGEFFYEGPMIFYIVHPFAIVVIRGFVKITKLQFLLTVRPLYFLAVAGCGLLGTYAVLLGRKYVRKLKKGR